MSSNFQCKKKLIISQSTNIITTSLVVFFLDVNTLFYIIFDRVTFISVIANIIFYIKNNQLAKKSLETAIHSTEIAKDVYLTSIRPSFSVICEAKGRAPFR